MAKLHIYLLLANSFFETRCQRFRTIGVMKGGFAGGEVNKLCEMKVFDVLNVVDWEIMLTFAHRLRVLTFKVIMHLH